MTFRSPHRRSRGRRGMSLIEVLLALTILVLALAAIGRLVDIGSERGAEARVYTRGTRLAQTKMAETEAGLVSLASESDGEFTGDDAVWKYKVTPEPAGPPNLYNVTVRVTREVNGRPYEIVLTQMLFDPTLMGSAAQAERPKAEDPETMPETDPAAGGTTP